MNKIHNRLERLIESLTITENQKSFLQEKVINLFDELKNISQNQIPYWSSLYLSKNTYQYTIDRFWLGRSFDNGLFIKNRFDINIYFVYKKNNTYPNEQNILINSLLFELLYSNLKIYQSRHRENMKILKNPPYRYIIPIRMDYLGTSINFDCIPAMELPNGNLLIPDGIGGTKKINQALLEKDLFKLNKKQNGKLNKLIILIKYWNFNWGKPLKGNIIECLVDYIFDKIKTIKWDRAVKTFFDQAIHIIDKKKFLPDIKYYQYSILNGYSSNELKNFLEVIREAKTYAQNGEWKKIFSDL
ncbi:MAG: hypothetical protein JSV23_02055 [Promethearchaeota archaeon]|nr:MAG: hypothetical protein JSV23_02055 [Candidatus Lokiarchaeota archaeon]